MYTYKAKCISVHDGDTLTLVIDVGFYMSFETKVRLVGINAPELKKATMTEAKRAKAYLEMLVMGMDLVADTIKGKDDFGRWLCTLQVVGEDKTVNLQMIEAHMAMSYME